jgi:AcrR family transcriptional regulator
MTPPPNPARRNEQSRKAILKAAYEQASEVGYRKLTIEAIAARAGVGKQTIYRWWPSKGAVVLEALNDYIGSAADFPDTGDVITDLRNQTTAVVALMNSPFGDVLAGLIGEGQSDPELAKGWLETIFYPRIRACPHRLAKAQQQGQLDPHADLDIAVEILYGPLYYRMLIRTAPLSPDHVSTVVTTAFAGLAAHPTDPTS